MRLFKLSMAWDIKYQYENTSSKKHPLFIDLASGDITNLLHNFLCFDADAGASYAGEAASVKTIKCMDGIH